MALVYLSSDRAIAGLRGQRVAIVGNSADVLKRKDGSTIDSYDVVIRMNAGIPDVSSQAARMALGTRTSILATASAGPLRRHRQDLVGQGVTCWWMKRTAYGMRELARLQREHSQLQHAIRMWLWPSATERAVQNWIAAPPSTGIRVIYAVYWAKPAAIGVFGCSWWGAAGGSPESHWQPGKVGPSPCHRPELEYAAFASLHWRNGAEGYFVRG